MQQQYGFGNGSNKTGEFLSSIAGPFCSTLGGVVPVPKSPSASQQPEPRAARPAALEQLFWRPVSFRKSQGEFVQALSK
jgi:hypothetical protein